ncbi:oleandomycin transport system ATP-binding protein [Saccharopolyspora antimicrobica]|uniref:Oleandomycin transport system ATP-binding protein n=1 Tax=Saccharopolyspora antimicrobica TaxID=455193 RepID=A0A1I5G7U9_9PSEU|nr:ATP-binding cassette domain-containing protein [Saccharopolyspora antimicrobica]RKT83885.1 oleandomycin transport system ATP-binding protein [Saccharopolyspora antimicrobica]SFO32064.1 oleandomycin transport system ATP-binding protein [Saccharopolyspora antimicrobica]
MSYAIQAEGLVKRFGSTTALAGVDLAVPAGTILGVLGPNGAGKTTTVRILATLLRPDAGTATVAGYDVLRQSVAVRSRIGLTGQYASVDEELTGVENLVLIGRLLEMPRGDAKARAAELLERFGLTDAGGRAIKTYSGGMRRRLDLAASLVGRPEILYLDEPTTGLDPRSRNQVWDMVRDLTGEGVTVLLTTQYLEEADQLADRISVIDHGRVVADGRADELKRRTGGQTLQVRPTDLANVPAVRRILAELTGAEPAVNDESGLLTAPVDDPVLLSTLVRRLDDAGITADELALRLPSLDEVFLAITGKPAEEAA